MVSQGGSGMPFQVLFAIGGVDTKGEHDGGDRILEHVGGGIQL